MSVSSGLIFLPESWREAFDWKHFLKLVSTQCLPQLKILLEGGEFFLYICPPPLQSCLSHPRCPHTWAEIFESAIKTWSYACMRKDISKVKTMPVIFNSVVFQFWSSLEIISLISWLVVAEDWEKKFCPKALSKLSYEISPDPSGSLPTPTALICVFSRIGIHPFPICASPDIISVYPAQHHQHQHHCYQPPHLHSQIVFTPASWSYLRSASAPHISLFYPTCPTPTAICAILLQRASNTQTGQTSQPSHCIYIILATCALPYNTSTDGFCW